MTSFDADALTSDPQGLEFLKGVLDLPPQGECRPDAFDPTVSRPSWTCHAGEPSRPQVSLLPEHA